MPLLGLLVFVGIIAWVFQNIPAWVWWSIGGLFVAVPAVYIITAIAEASEKKKLEKRAAELAEAHRNRPLAEGETVYDRMSSVYHEQLGGWIPKVAEEYLAYWNAVPPSIPMSQRLAIIRQQMDDVLSAKLRDHVVPHIADDMKRVTTDVIYRHDATFRSIFEASILQHVERLRVAYRDPGMSPIQFEKWCESALRWSGWTAAATKASGDQGADVVATKDGVKVVLQCKLFSRPVGNAAVQEIFAAKAHYGAAGAAVVSNQVYTPAAQQLARSCGVKLLHADDLMNFNNYSWS